jgi:uncharacterized protein YwgA
MPVSEITLPFLYIGGLITMTAVITAMFVTLRERVKNHDHRLRYHAEIISDLKSVESDNAAEFREIKTTLEYIKKLLDDLKKCIK